MPAEVAKLESYVDGVLWGHLQISDGDTKVRCPQEPVLLSAGPRSRLHIRPDAELEKLDELEQEAGGRCRPLLQLSACVAAYWSLYIRAQYKGIVVIKHPGSWYLDQAYETSLAMCTQAPYYTRYGQMEGTVFLRLLKI